MSTISSTAEIYDAFAKHYREYSQKKTAYIEGVNGLVKDHFKDRVHSVFDFGCGDGIRGGILFKELNAQNLICGDISQEMIQRTRSLGIAADVWDLSKTDWHKQSIRFDLIMSLWNVFGHIPNMDERIFALRKMSDLLSPKGRICLDINNRHYRGYGWSRVQLRRLIDWLYADYRRGDVHFDWNIDGKKYPAHGHLFTAHEIKELVSRAGLEIVSHNFVDYATGKKGNSVIDGQHFLILRRADEKN